MGGEEEEEVIEAAMAGASHPAVALRGGGRFPRDAAVVAGARLPGLALRPAPAPGPPLADFLSFREDWSPPPLQENINKRSPLVWKKQRNK